MSVASAGHPQAPHLGWAKRLLGPLHVTGVFWFKVPYWFFTWLPAAWTGFMVLLFTTLFFVTLRRIGAAIAANLEAALGPAGFLGTQSRVYRTMRAFAWCHAERYEQLHDRGGFKVAVEGVEHLQALQRPAEGFIFVTAHIGGWESSSRLVSGHVDRWAHVVREEELDPRAQAFMERALARHGVMRYTTHFAANDPRLGIELKNALQQGHVVALQADRPRVGGRAINTLLFGRETRLPAGPATLARTAGVPLLPVFSFREGRKSYRVVVRPPIRVSQDAEKSQALSDAAQQLAREIEWAIRERPHQWFCFGRLWPEAGAGEPNAQPAA
jgi:KDO2-lipid IV(A) lauroyltransferase